MPETDLPRYDSDPAAWIGPDLVRHPDRWTYRLTDEQVADLEETARRLDATGDAIVSLTARDAPLPALAETLATLKEDLLFGIGFCLIRGVPVERMTLRQSAIAFWSLGAHLGNAVSQNAKGHALGHVRDLGFDYSKPSARGYQTSERLPYHCDMGDVVGLLSLRTGQSGGLSSLVSSVTLYNAMAKQRPDLVRVLMQPTWRDRRDEIPEDRKPWYPMPVFNPSGDRMFTHYVRSVIRKAQRFDEVPRISAEQEEAFDYLDAMANGPDYHLDMEFLPGDVQFLCNHTIMHSRTKYVDWKEPERKRHLLRLWLACPGGPEVPDSFREFQGLDAAGRPQGIKCPGAELNAPLEAEDGGAGASGKRLPGAAV